MTLGLIKSKRISLAVSVAVSVVFSLWGSPSFAGDPFRSSNPRPIGDKTEAALIAVFRQGNYKQAMIYATEATQTEANDPLAHAIRSALAFANEDMDTMKTYASKTLQTAQQLKATDPLRANLYIGFGNFLEVAYLMQQKNYLAAVSQGQQVLDSLDAAEKISPEDPELNLLKGYLELFLSKYLPFSDSEKAIQRFDKYAAPDYIKYRALADVYRDQKKYDKALELMKQAIQISPDNPELEYLKGQVLRIQGKQSNNVALLKEAFSCFEQAKKKEDQLSKVALIPLQHDYQVVQGEIKQLDVNTQSSKQP